MARRVCQAVFAVALAYALALGVFAFARYRHGERPDAVGVARDFHRWVRSLLPKPSPPTPDPGGVPPPRESPPREPLPRDPLPLGSPAEQPLHAPGAR